MKRRALLALPGVGLLGALLSACGLMGGNPRSGPTREPSGVGEGKKTYGEDASQFGELYLPQGTPRGVVVVIHGGFWLAQYDLSLGAPLATSLADNGWAAWNLEYRRIGSPGSGGGGGDPATFDDIAAGIEKLADLDVPLDNVITLGHSAGGHLAVWAAARGRDGGWPDTVKLKAAISQAGVLDLRAAYDEDLGGGAVENFLGHKPTEKDGPVDPQQQIPLDIPVHCIHATGDGNVPISQSQDYVRAATAAGATADLTTVQGDHFTLIDTTSDAWTKTLAILDKLG